MALADRLQRVLDLRGLTPYDLSKRAGLSQSQVRIWIDRKSERVSTEALRKVAAAAEVSALWLITGSGSPDDDEAREEAGETSAGSAPPATASEEHRAPVELPPGCLGDSPTYPARKKTARRARPARAVSGRRVGRNHPRAHPRQGVQRHRALKFVPRKT